jgi:hypothetical protein
VSCIDTFIQKEMKLEYLEQRLAGQVAIVKAMRRENLIGDISPYFSGDDDSMTGPVAVVDGEALMH